MAAGTDGGSCGRLRTIVQNRRLYQLGDHSSALKAHALRGVDRLVVLHQANPAKILQWLEQPRLSALLVVDVCTDAHLQRVPHCMDERLLRPQPLPHAVGVDVLVDADAPSMRLKEACTSCRYGTPWPAAPSPTYGGSPKGWWSSTHPASAPAPRRAIAGTESVPRHSTVPRHATDRSVPLVRLEVLSLAGCKTCPQIAVEAWRGRAPVRPGPALRQPAWPLQPESSAESSGLTSTAHSTSGRTPRPRRDAKCRKVW
eukprot:scaffold1519_cov69-Phaeocystis_antarctica.AAC.5